MKKIYLISLFFLFSFNAFAEEGISNQCFVEAESGKSIFSMEEGIVQKIGYEFEKGNYITIKYLSTGLTITYCNLTKASVKKGQRVEKGQKIGTTGRTGAIIKSGITLYIEFDEDGMQFNQSTTDITKIINLFGE